MATFQQLLTDKSPFQTRIKGKQADKSDTVCEEDPTDIIIIQSESFFDPRPMWSGIKPEILQTFDQACSNSLTHGLLSVPAWGANTLRTEFAFLSVIPNYELKHYRFNPYQYLQKQSVNTLASHLKSKGYYCIAIHPNTSDFFRRNKVFPLMGFDKFIDIDDFNKDDTDGPYISDDAITQKINETLKEHQDKQPLFIFVITMENHGPLHLESISKKDTHKMYQDFPSFQHHDLSVYLRHLNNADAMLKCQLETLKHRKRTTMVGFYGDHVPSMPKVYNHLNFRSAETKFFIWSNAESYSNNL